MDNNFIGHRNRKYVVSARHILKLWWRFITPEDHSLSAVLIFWLQEVSN